MWSEQRGSCNSRAWLPVGWRQCVLSVIVTDQYPHTMCSNYAYYRSNKQTGDSSEYCENFVPISIIQAALKTIDTCGNCQRPVFSLAASQHMQNITNLWKFELNWSLELWDINERKKKPLSHEVVCFKMFDFETSNLCWELIWVITNIVHTAFKILKEKHQCCTQCVYASISDCWEIQMPEKGFVP